MKEQGYRVVTLWMSPGEWELCKKAARELRKPLATWIRERATGIAAAELQAGCVQVQPVVWDDEQELFVPR